MEVERNGKNAIIQKKDKAMKNENTCFVVLYSNKISATHDFFKAINASIKEYEKDKVVVMWGGVELHYVTPESELLDDYRYVSIDRNRGAGILFYAQSESLEKSYSEVKSAGGTIKSPISKNHWDMREFLFEDPNGFKFVVYGI